MDLQKPADELRPTHLRIPARFTHFANGEFKTEILTSIRNVDVYVVQDVENHYPLAMNRGETRALGAVGQRPHLLPAHRGRRGPARRGQARSPRSCPPTRTPGSTRRRAGKGCPRPASGSSWSTSGSERIITLDLHSKDIENSFNRLRVENLHASYQILKVLASVVDLADPDLTIISADTGSIDRNRFYATALGRSLGMIYKERDYSRASTSAKHDNIVKVSLLGSVEGKTVFMADDMLGTGGTLLRAMRILKEQGAARIICAVSLPVLQRQRRRRPSRKPTGRVCSTASSGPTPCTTTRACSAREWYLSADVTNLFARSLYRLHANRSLSSLLDNREIIKDLLDRSRGEGPQKELKL